MPVGTSSHCVVRLRKLQKQETRASRVARWSLATVIPVFNAWCRATAAARVDRSCARLEQQAAEAKALHAEKEVQKSALIDRMATVKANAHGKLSGLSDANRKLAAALEQKDKELVEAEAVAKHLRRAAGKQGEKEVELQLALDQCRAELQRTQHTFAQTQRARVAEHDAGVAHTGTRTPSSVSPRVQVVGAGRLAAIPKPVNEERKGQREQLATVQGRVRMGAAANPSQNRVAHRAALSARIAARIDRCVHLVTHLVDETARRRRRREGQPASRRTGTGRHDCTGAGKSGGRVSSGGAEGVGDQHARSTGQGRGSSETDLQRR